jgi:hypothetical protein
MGYAVQVVFGFEYTAFARDSEWNATFAFRSFYIQGVDMDYRFLIWSSQNWNNIHPFKLSARLYQWRKKTQWHKLQVDMPTVAKKWKREIVLSMLGQLFQIL